MGDALELEEAALMLGIALGLMDIVILVGAGLLVCYAVWEAAIKRQ